MAGRRQERQAASMRGRCDDCWRALIMKIFRQLLRLPLIETERAAAKACGKEATGDALREILIPPSRK